MTDFISITSNLWNITPHECKKRDRCLRLYMKVDELLSTSSSTSSSTLSSTSSSTSNDNHVIVKTLMKTRECDSVLESGDFPILRSALMNSIRYENLMMIRTNNLLYNFEPWKKIMKTHVNGILFNNMYVNEYVLYKLRGWYKQLK